MFLISASNLIVRGATVLCGGNLLVVTHAMEGREQNDYVNLLCMI